MTDTTKDPFDDLPDVPDSTPIEALDAVPAVKLGDSVVYISEGGKQKTALVIGTALSIVPGTQLAEALGKSEGLADNELILLVLSPTGNVYPRGPVPYGTLPDRRVWALAE